MTRQQKTEELFASYRLVKVLSDKNECRVLQLRHKTLQKDIVLHSLPKAVSAYEILCSIHTAHLPDIYDVFTLDDGMIALEEFVDGMTVAEIMETGRYTYRGAAKVILGVCEALDVLHRKQIVHRDVKPENVMVTPDGRVVLLDFNASRRLSGAAHDTVFLGTIGYAPPEQFGLTESDARSDVFAVGVLFNVMLTGCHPSQRQAHGRAGRIIAKCVQVNPENRYQSARELASAL